WPIRLAPHGVVLAGKNPVEIRCGANQCQMRECLWEVAEMLPAWTNLFRVESKMVGVSQEFLKQQLSLFQLPSARQAFDVPKRAGGEAAFSTWKPVHVRFFGLIATDKGILD